MSLLLAQIDATATEYSEPLPRTPARKQAEQINIEEPKEANTLALLHDAYSG